MVTELALDTLYLGLPVLNSWFYLQFQLPFMCTMGDSVEGSNRLGSSHPHERPRFGNLHLTLTVVGIWRMNLSPLSNT